MADEFRTPYDSGYVAAIGRAIYIFAIYEWTVIYTIEKLRPGFLNKWRFAQNPMTARTVGRKFTNAVNESSDRAFPSTLKLHQAGWLNRMSIHTLTGTAIRQPSQLPRRSDSTAFLEVSGFESASFPNCRTTSASSLKAFCRSLIAFFTPSFTTRPSRSIVFFAGGGSSIRQILQLLQRPMPIVFRRTYKCQR
jgi:hypothetical protein